MKNLIKNLTVIAEPNMTILKFKKANYDLLVFDKGNRKYGEFASDKGKHSRNLGELMGKFNTCGLGTVCIENGKFSIADGQNRISELMRTEQDVCVFLSAGNLEDTIVSLNTSAKNLTKQDFIHLVATKGNKDFKVLEEILAESAQITKESKRLTQDKSKFLFIPNALLISIYSQTRRSDAQKIVQDKSFKIVNKKEGDKIVKYIYDLQKVGLKNGLRHSEGFTMLLAEKGEEYNHTVMLKRLKAKLENDDKINLYDSPKLIANTLNDIYENIIKLKKAA